MDSDSTDIEEELPLNRIKTVNCMRSYNFVPYAILCKASIQKCDFCETISKNKYSSLVHNAKHIIIPLLKQSVYQCGKCLHHFTSQTSLNNHIVIKHDITQRTQQKTDFNNIRVFNPNYNLSIVDHNSKIMNHNANNTNLDKKNMNHNANDSNCDKEIMSHNRYTLNCDKKILNHNTNNSNCEKKIMNHITNNSNCDKKIMNHNANNSNCDKKIMNHNANSNRDKKIMNHNANNSNCDKKIMNHNANNSNCDKKIMNHNANNSNCDKKIMKNDTNNLNCDKKPMNYGSENGYSNINSKHRLDIKSRLLFEEDVIESNVLLCRFPAECNVDLKVFKLPQQTDSDKKLTYKTFGFEELMSPGVFRCKKCSKTFSNRYDAVIHETTHLTLRNCQIIKCDICKQYIDGAKSELNRHYIDVHASQSQCKKCGVMCCDVEEHRMPYGPLEGINTKVNFIEYSKKLLNLCQLCFSFCRNTHNRQYKCVGSLCQLGKRFACNRCGTMSFELLLVERVLRFIEKDRDVTKRKQPSNEARLKNITTRLKRLRK